MVFFADWEKTGIFRLFFQAMHNHITNLRKEAHWFLQELSSRVMHDLSPCGTVVFLL